MDPQNGPLQFINACRKMCPSSLNENKYPSADLNTAKQVVFPTCKLLFMSSTGKLNTAWEQPL